MIIRLGPFVKPRVRLPIRAPYQHLRKTLHKYSSMLCFLFTQFIRLPLQMVMFLCYDIITSLITPYKPKHSVVIVVIYYGEKWRPSLLLFTRSKLLFHITKQNNRLLDWQRWILWECRGSFQIIERLFLYSFRFTRHTKSNIPTIQLSSNSTVNVLYKVPVSIQRLCN